MVFPRPPRAGILASSARKRVAMTKAASAAAKDLAAAGVSGVHLAWADNNGIPRSRIVPIAGLADAAGRGVGATSLFAVFDSHDSITYRHPWLATPSGDIRLVPVVDRLRRLAGQPALAWAPVRQIAADGREWPYCQRSVLERQVAEAARRGLEFRADDTPPTVVLDRRGQV